MGNKTEPRSPINERRGRYLNIVNEQVKVSLLHNGLSGESNLPAQPIVNSIRRVMNCLRLLPKCECGSFVQPTSFWLTDQRQLWLVGVCFACEKPVNTLYSLTELYKGCPLNDKNLDKAIGKAIQKITSVLPIQTSLTWNAEDKKFLHAMRISPDDV